MTRPPAPQRPYTGPPSKSSPGDNKPIHRVVIHSTVSPCEPGGARKISAYFRSDRAGGSAHYVVDPGEAVQSAWDSVICWHAPPNRGSIGVEMCDIPGPIPSGGLFGNLARRLRRSWRWARKPQRQMLRRTARLTAELCAHYDIPPRFRGVAGLRAGKRGVTTHANVSRAFGQSTHWDPGFWPQAMFMRWVRADYARIMRAHTDNN